MAKRKADNIAEELAALRSQRERDEFYMGRCLELARRAEGRTVPYPMSGCLIVDDDGEIAAEGYLFGPAARPAELVALTQMKGQADGLTMYVSMEPFHGKVTEREHSCAVAIAKAGIARVVIGMTHPVRELSGGAAWLGRQGIAVTRGILRNACRELNRVYLMGLEHGRAYIALKVGMTLDGHVATRTGESQWITGTEARRDSHRLRDRLNGVMVGVGTVLADDPQLSVRDVRGGRDPVRIVLDSQLRTPVSARLLPANSKTSARKSPPRAIIATTEAAPPARERRLIDAGAEVWRLGSGPRVDLEALVNTLPEHDIASVLVEGGPTVHGALIEADLADELIVYMAPMILGGQGRAAGLNWVGGSGVATLAEAPRFRFEGDVRYVGGDVAISLRREPSRDSR